MVPRCGIVRQISPSNTRSGPRGSGIPFLILQVLVVVLQSHILSLSTAHHSRSSQSIRPDSQPSWVRPVYIRPRTKQLQRTVTPTARPAYLNRCSKSVFMYESKVRLSSNGHHPYKVLSLKVYTVDTRSLVSHQ